MFLFCNALGQQNGMHHEVHGHNFTLQMFHTAAPNKDGMEKLCKEKI